MYRILDIASEFQTLIVGFIGFAGVIATLILNARGDRAARDDQRRFELQSIRAALLSELTIVRDALALNKSRIADTKTTGSGTVLVPITMLDNVFRTFLPQVGLLTPDEAHKVLNAYLTQVTLRDSIYLFGTTDVRMPYHVVVPEANYKALEMLYNGLSTPVDEAIAALSSGGAESVVPTRVETNGAQAAPAEGDERSHR